MKTSGAILASLLAAALTAHAKEWYYIGASNDWWNAASFTTNTSSKVVNTVMPGKGDIIHPSRGQRLYMDDTTVAFLNTVNAFYFPFDDSTWKPEAGASLYINLTTNATVTCAIGEYGGHSYYHNWLVKDGAGSLQLDGRNGLNPTHGIYSTSSFRYAISFDVRAGELHLEPKRSGVTRQTLGGLKIARGAALYTSSGTDQTLNFHGNLEGAGDLNTDNADTAYTVTIEGDPQTWKNDPPTEFSGRLLGKIDVYLYHSTYLTGTNNTANLIHGGFYDEGSENCGVVGVKTWAGSFKKQSMTTQRGSMCLRFLNDADETVKFSSGIYYREAGTLAIDAGARGGLKILSSNWWGLQNGRTTQGRFILTGSNTVTSTLYGPSTRADSGASFFFKKKGTGTWRVNFDDKIDGMQYNAATCLRGVFAVDEGTLETVSLAEKGQKCSLGYADELYEDKIAETGTLATVPYAIRLGTPKTGEGTLSYVGTAGKAITTRPIAVQGKGRLKAPNAPYLHWKNVSGLASGVENAMTFECAAGQTNVVTDLSGDLSVVKDGPGDLIVKGDVTATGDWVAKAGTMTVLNYPSGTPYSWFKLTIKETAATSELADYAHLTPKVEDSWTGRYHRRFDIEEFGLYDSAGKRVNAYVTAYPSTMPAWTEELLQPGQIVGSPANFVSPFDNGGYYQAQFALDNHTRWAEVSAYKSCSYHWNDYTKLIRKSDPTTWISLVHRLKTEDVGKVARWDVCQVAGTNTLWTVTSLELFGSADGTNWDSLGATNDYVCLTSKRCWLSGSAAIGGEADVEKAATHPKFALSRTTTSTGATVNAPRSVSVAKGATLALEGAAVTVSKLVVSADGAGTLDGAFAFAESGTVEIPDLPKVGTLAIPLACTGCTGLDRFPNWTVTSGGKQVNCSAKYENGSLVVMKRGFLFLLK